MAVWGIGAYYGNTDVHKEFIKQNCVCIGWSREDAPSLHQMFDSIKVGDIVYIKSFSPRNKELHIKAVGIVTDTEKRDLKHLGTGITVKWKVGAKFEPIPISPKMFKYNVYNNTQYEEFDITVIEKLLDALIA